MAAPYLRNLTVTKRRLFFYTAPLSIRKNTLKNDKILGRANFGKGIGANFGKGIIISGRA